MKLQLGKIYYEESLQGERVFYYCIDTFVHNGESLIYYDLSQPEETYFGDVEICERYWKELDKGENK